MHRRGFALCFVFALTSAPAHAASVDDYVGEWRGTVERFGRAPASPSVRFEAQVTLGRRADGALGGTTYYPGSKCVGELHLASMDATMLGFTETINLGKDKCLPGALVIALDPSGKLDSVWTSSDGSLANAKLTRVVTAAPSASTQPPTTVEIVTDPKAIARARWEANEKQWKEHVAALVDGPDPAYPSGHDFMPVLVRLAGTDSRSLGLANYVIAMPEYYATPAVFDYAAGLAEKFGLQLDAVRTVQQNHRIQLDNANGDIKNGAIARALQSVWDKIFRLEARASSGRDPDAARRYAALLDLAHSTKALEQLMQISAQQYEVRRRLLERYERLERIDSPGRAEYIAGYQVIVLRTALASYTLDEAKKSTADMDRKLNKVLTDLARGQLFDFFGALFSGGGGGGGGSSGTTKFCRDVYSEPQTIYNQYSGTYDTIPGSRIRESCD